MSAHITKIPKELIMTIFGYLPSEDRARLCSVCHKFTPLAIAATKSLLVCPWLAKPECIFRPNDVMALVEFGDYHEISRRKNLILMMPMPCVQYRDEFKTALLMKSFESGNNAVMDVIFEYVIHTHDQHRVKIDHYLTPSILCSICTLGCNAAMIKLHAKKLLDKQFTGSTLMECMRIAYNEQNTVLEDLISTLQPMDQCDRNGKLEARPCVKKASKYCKLKSYVKWNHFYPGSVFNTLIPRRHLPWHDDLIAMMAHRQKKVIWVTENYKHDVDWFKSEMSLEFVDYVTNHLNCVVYEPYEEDFKDGLNGILSMELVAESIAGRISAKSITNEIITVIMYVECGDNIDNIHEIIESTHANGVAGFELNVMVFDSSFGDVKYAKCDNYAVYTTKDYALVSL